MVNENKPEAKAPEAKADGPVNSRTLADTKTHEEEEIAYDAKEQGDLNLKLMSAKCKQKYDALIASIGGEDKYEMRNISDPETGISMLYLPGSYIKLNAEGKPEKGDNGKNVYVPHLGLPGKVMIQPKMLTNEQVLQLPAAMSRFRQTMAPQLEYNYMLERDIRQRKQDVNLLED
nr:hypothetical protein [uncultured Methanolobus sp.]